MKIHSVELTGFGPYKNTELVDLDAFGDDGVFLITGRTGAGKSSILDAITFGLYGSIPRYQGGPGDKVRSDHIGPNDPCQVTVIFTVDQHRYRVRRSPEWERPKQRGDGTTRQAPTAEFSIWKDEDWQVTEAQVRNVGLAISQVVGLSVEQFLQVILLAQGQFQEFLVADSSARRDLLRSLFQTARFGDYSDRLEERARQLRTALQAATSTVGAHLSTLGRVAEREVPDEVDAETGDGVQEWVAALLSDHDSRVEVAGAEASAARTAFAEAQQKWTLASTTAERQQRLRRATEQGEALRVAAEEIAELRGQLDRARLAAPVQPVAVAADAAAEATAAAGQQHTAAVAAYRASLPGPDDVDFAALTVAELNAAVAAADQLLGTLTEHQRTEESLPALRAAAQDATGALDHFDTKAAQVRLDREEARTSITALTDRITVLEDQTASAAEVERDLADARRRLGFAEQAQATQAEVERAREAQAAAGQALTRASSARDQVRARQLSDYAATLAGGLLAGEPCPVCGSAEHPDPTSAPPDHVTDEDLAAADAAFERADADSRAADQSVTSLITRLAGERAEAGDGDLDDLTAQVATGQQRATDLTAAATELATTKRRRTEAEKRAADLSDDVERSAKDRQERLTAQHAAETRLAAATETVAAARGEHDRVADRVVLERRRRDAARALARAIEDRDRAASDARRSATDLTAALADAGFTDRAALEAARAPQGDQRLWDQRIAAHEAGLAAVAATLADPDLADLPAEPVDLAAPQRDRDRAETAQADAVAALSREQALLDGVSGTATAIRAELAAAAATREKYHVVNALALTVRGREPNELRMSLETFVLAAELEDIVVAANTRLTVMTSGRYTFAHSDELAGRNRQSGLSLNVIDAHTGEARSPQSLSGGEKFQASLALALGLAEVVTAQAGGVRLDTLFIDEGFGSLDAETLETTMATLDSLREGGRTVGLISHVEAMKESIPAKVFVDIAPGGWSTIR